MVLGLGHAKVGYCVFGTHKSGHLCMCGDGVGICIACHCECVVLGLGSQSNASNNGGQPHQLSR